MSYVKCILTKYLCLCVAGTIAETVADTTHAQASPHVRQGLGRIKSPKLIHVRNVVYPQAYFAPLESLLPVKTGAVERGQSSF